jgi:hypothetical protein
MPPPRVMVERRSEPERWVEPPARIVPGDTTPRPLRRRIRLRHIPTLKELAEKFMAGVSSGPSCWMRKQTKVRYAGKNWNAPRFSWLIHRGEIPPGMFVCHHCDTPRCINPDHLFLGTPKDNFDDAVRKGRIRPFTVVLEEKKLYDEYGSSDW